MLLIRILLLCALIISVNSKCATGYITKCENVVDVKRFGLKSWENLLISPNACSKVTVGTLNEILVPNFFGDAKNIEELYIVDKITEIEPYAFSGLNHLTYVKLYKNQIKVVPEGAFSNLPNSVKIDLQHNSIENIVHGLFSNSSIRDINLSNNKLNNIQIDKVNLPSLEKLKVKYNDISYIAAGSFHENLEYLNLAHNSIAQFEKGVLEPLKNLRELILSHNRFKDVSLNFSFPNLDTLDLSHNSIVSIQEGSFRQFLDLKNLKLNHNYITHLSHNIFAIGNSIRSLHLHYNAMMEIPELVGRILGQLEEITISGNPWACPCLQMIATYLNERNITEPDCDKSYFTVGKSAVCVVSGEECTGDEELTKEAFESFQKSLNTDLCSNL